MEKGADTEGAWSMERSKIRRKQAAAILALAAVLLSGCRSAWVYDPITDVNDLHHRRIGVNLSYEADYLLTGRDDMELFRYDATSDMILALRYDKVDALAMDELTWRIMDGLSDGMKKVEPGIGSTEYIMYFGADDEALAEDFNRFLAEYKRTDAYRDFLRRLDDFDGVHYEDPGIPLTGTGETIRVVLDPAVFPRAYQEAGQDEALGFDLEALKLFANDRGYRLAFYFSTYSDSVTGLQKGGYDIQVGGLSTVYEEEVLAAGLFTSDDLYESDLCLVEKTQPDIVVDVEALE